MCVVECGRREVCGDADFAERYDESNDDDWRFLKIPGILKIL